MKILALYMSSAHNFFGHHGRPPGESEMLEVPEVQCLAGRGVLGDRFCDHQQDYKGQITFFAAEVHRAISTELGVWNRPVSVFRRNVITEGMDLNGLIGAEFEIQGVRFRGVEECKPCHWMDQAFSPGAEQFLKGRGGLRSVILTDGTLRVDWS